MHDDLQDVLSEIRQVAKSVWSHFINVLKQIRSICVYVYK